MIDNGIGIPFEKQKDIFERFEQVDNSLTRASEGTGLGLTLVKKLVEALGGSISLKSETGMGCTFTVLLPVEKVLEDENHELSEESVNNRLTQALAVEFSDIYMHV